MNDVFALGSNGSGQLGIGHKEDVSVPKQALFHPEDPTTHITKIAAGGNHTLLLTSSDGLYWSGDASTGACGPIAKAQPNIPLFQKVTLAENAPQGAVKLIAATWEASIVVQEDSEGKNTLVSTFGLGQKGELGQGHFIVRTPNVSPVPNFPPPGTEVVDLAACMGHVVIVLSNGDAYGWGNGRKGQLGLPEAVLYEPRKIDGISFPILRAVCGKDFTCLFGSAEKGEISILGSDKWTIKSAAPTSAPGWKDVAASWGNVYVLMQGGQLLSWGRNDHGQLAPANVPKLLKIAVGSEHVVALSDEGEVLAWGWGEHGNCGPQVENNDVKGRWNVIASSKYIPPDTSITSIGAGCATSWIRIGVSS